ncbi:hypothetical protein [Ktedonospora formicarum]|uniref:PAP2 superfamily protein n=1 Tax=Ktedonospora formicarum TaxID=2778364 RepID=A0A8J3MVC2_9CHLR|nr:hypothetical protein [Ktedonospora formicarum]GHO49180.1 hypothetical protein KSX_73430 [Ktedonospora formicarum]
MERSAQPTGEEKFSSFKGPWEKLAYVVSTVTNPLFVALPLCLLVAIATAPNVWQGLLWWVVTAVGVSLAPLIFVWQGVRRGRYTDHHVSRREQRLVPMLFATGCVALVFVGLLLLHASSHLLATMVAVIVAVLLALIITKFTKISLHMVGMAGAVTVIILMYGPIFLSLTPLVFVVGWARWQVRAHTSFQALIGTVLAAVVTVITFRLFGLF